MSTDLVAFLASVGGYHEDDPAVFIDFVKKAEPADPVSPRLRFVSLEFFDIPAEERLDTELGIDVVTESRDELLPSRSEMRLEVGLKLLRFEDPEISQRSGPDPS